MIRAHIGTGLNSRGGGVPSQSRPSRPNQGGGFNKPAGGGEAKIFFARQRRVKKIRLKTGQKRKNGRKNCLFPANFYIWDSLKQLFIKTDNFLESFEFSRLKIVDFCPKWPFSGGKMLMMMMLMIMIDIQNNDNDVDDTEYQH